MQNNEELLKTLDEIFGGLSQDLLQENANTNGRSPNGQLSVSASEVSKMYAVERLLSEDVKQAYKDGYIHIHDLDFYATGTTTCCQIPLGKLLGEGFYVGDCYMRQPQSITSAMALVSIIFQSNQNCQHGGQACANFDFDLAPYVKKTYERHLYDLKKIKTKYTFKRLELIAMERTKYELDQSTEAFIHNCNSMLCRNGQQVPFISVNFGLDTSKWGRMFSESLMEMQIKGLGDGSTPIFPILIFKMKDGINKKKGDPNYDLYKLALECTSKRLFPNFVNCDATFNYNPSGDLTKEIATMGCRTRVFNDVNGEPNPNGRGNLSFTTLNLPMIAKEYMDINEKEKHIKTPAEKNAFIRHMDKYIDICIKQLKERMEYQKNCTMANYQFLYQNGSWAGGEKLAKTDKIGDVLNNGTLSIGFIGLAETLKILVGKHHAEDEKAYEFGYKIIKHLKERMDKQCKIDNLNWSCLGTPAEGYAGKSLRIFKAKHGEIEGVSDHEYFTNSFHVPVYFEIKAFEKVKLEAPFHELTNAGHITYIELDGQASKNIKALDKLVQYMMDSNIGYCSLNHKNDTCRNCGHQGIFDDYVCTECGSDNVQKIARITGYLVGDIKRWNSAKRHELEDRVEHK